MAVSDGEPAEMTLKDTYWSPIGGGCFSVAKSCPILCDPID